MNLKDQNDLESQNSLSYHHNRKGEQAKHKNDAEQTKIYC